MKTAVLQYFRIEWKRACVGIGHMILSLVVMAAVLLGAAAGTARLMERAGSVFAPIRICLAGIPEESRMRDIVSLLGSMDSIRNICRFEIVDSEEELQEKLNSGEANAGVLLPENFYRDIMTGVNTPAVVYAPEEGIMTTDLFREMVQDGVSLIRSSESGIYAASEQAMSTPIAMDSIRDMDVLLTDLYIRTCLNRLDIYTTGTRSVLGDLTLPEYYSAVALALLLFGFGLNFSFLFNVQNREMERKLRVYGVSTLRDGLVKTLVISAAMWLLLLVPSIPGLAILSSRGMISLPVSIFGIWLRFFPAVLMAGAFDYFIYTLTRRSGHSGIIFLLLGLYMIFAGGCILPSSFLPEIIQTTGAVMPVSLWRSYFAAALTEWRMSAGEVLRMLAVAAAFLTAGVIAGAAEDRMRAAQ